MDALLPAAGGVSPELARHTHDYWAAAAAKSGIDMANFAPNTPLHARLAWAQVRGLDVATILARFSTRMQHSTTSQVEENLAYAAAHKFYVPPEFVCVDEAISGRKTRRDGLDRAKLFLQNRLACTLLVFKVSRLFRVGYKGFAFFQEEVVDEGLRAISVSQGIDTADSKSWKNLTYLHGMADEMLVEAIGDHVRSELKSLFAAGYVTGALPVGYQPVEVPGMPTKLGRPRTSPRVIPKIAALIRQHYLWIREGMTINEGWKRWVKDNGPRDPRSRLTCMSRASYRRMLSNPRYVGIWAFGRKRNRWSSKRDYTQQLEQPESEVTVCRCEDLRIIDDELFQAVQTALARLKIGPRGPKRRKEVQLWDVVTDCFHCPHCKVRFHQAGANGKGMRCKNGDLCPHLSVVRRKDAVQAICKELGVLVNRDAELVENTLCRAVERDAAGDDSLRESTAIQQRRVEACDRKCADLLDMAGQGSERDRAEVKARLRAAQAERMEAEAEFARLCKLLAGSQATLTAEGARTILGEFGTLLEDAAGGRLGEDEIHRAEKVFRRLTGDVIRVYVEPRPGRKRTCVRGNFTPQIVRAVADEGNTTVPAAACGAEVQVWLRPPPRRDLLAERVHELIDVECKSYGETTEALRREGHPVNFANIWQYYRRYYEMQGLRAPKRPYNNGRPRRRPTQ